LREVKTGSPPEVNQGGMKVKLRFTGSSCLLALATTFSSTSSGQPPESLLPVIQEGINAIPVAVWIAIIGLIALDVIARRGSAGK
jgi:type IV secretory pathway VirB2 component (pilin)